MSTAALSECCTLCAAKNLQILRLGRLNRICFVCLCAFGIGTAGLTAFFLYKYYKLKKIVSDLQQNAESLSEQLNFFDNDDSSTDLISLSRNSSAVSLASSSRLSRFDRSRSIVTNDDTDDSEQFTFITPSTSPERINKVTFNEQDNQFIDYLDLLSLTTDNNHLDDNTLIDSYLNETYQSLKQICNLKEFQFNKDEENYAKIIELIKAFYILGDKEQNLNLKKNIQYKAVDLAKRCLILEPNCYVSYKWYAISIGRIIDYLTMNEKVKYGFEFKEYLDKAISLNQKDYLLYYLRGRWSFKMCNLSWAEKYGVKLIFGKVPDVTFENAMNDFLKAEQLNPNKSKGNLLHLAKCFIEKNQIPKAVEYLNSALKIPIRTKEHEKDTEEIKSLLKKFSNF